MILILPFEMIHEGFGRVLWIEINVGKLCIDYLNDLVGKEGVGEHLRLKRGITTDFLLCTAAAAVETREE